MQIGKIGFNTTKNTTQTNNTPKTNINTGAKLTTNPFGVSFKGNVIQADVFENGNKKSIGENIAERGKVFASAVVSGINNFNEAFKSRMNSVVSFGKKITSNVFDTLERIGNTEVTFDMSGIKNKLFPDRQYSVKNLTNKPVGELKTMWTELSGIEE
ncbi:hypothetical protein II906_07075 [bacterium]|nr:hypothetical protein [bacterium]